MVEGQPEVLALVEEDQCDQEEDQVSEEDLEDLHHTTGLQAVVCVAAVCPKDPMI